MDDVPDGVLTPAEVSSAFQHHRDDPKGAVEELRAAAAGKYCDRDWTREGALYALCCVW